MDSVTQIEYSKADFDAEKHLPNGSLPQRFDIIESLDHFYPTPTAKGKAQSREEVFWRTLITDTSGKVRPGHHPSLPELSTSFYHWLLQVSSGIVETARAGITQGVAIIPERL